MNKELTSKEQEAKAFMFDKFIPALHDVLLMADPVKYVHWNGNACRQAAIFGVHYLKELLPEYKWYVWDGDFEDLVSVEGQLHPTNYNHAWIYGIDWKTKRKLLVDLSRTLHEQLFIVVEDNEYPKDHPDYMFMKVLRKHKMDIKVRMKEKEYYTALKGPKVIELIDEKIKEMVAK